MSAATPDIAGLLASIGGGGGGPMMGGAPPQGPSEETQESGGDPVSILKDLFSLVQDYLSVEQDEEDKKAGTDILRLVQTLLAKNQADMDAALGGQNSRLLRKAG